MKGIWIVKLIEGTFVTRYTFFDCESALSFAYDRTGYEGIRVAVKYRAGDYVVR